jgi:hypothetical protein
LASMSDCGLLGSGSQPFILPLLVLAPLSEKRC